LLLTHVEIGPALRRAFTVAGFVLIGFVLCFTFKYYEWGLGRSGLDMTFIALGACMLIAVAAKSQWEAPSVLRPVLTMGRRSYEIYLTHMFVVFAAFDRFLGAGKPMAAVPVLFIVVIVLAVLAGELVARFYSEPLNRRLRAYWSEGPRELGSVVEHG
jgi:peptidoglycan/LPS O-acetylase OafA/YrhL